MGGGCAFAFMGLIKDAQKIKFLSDHKNCADNCSND